MAGMFSLTQLKQGINRLRTKGGANPESLYDLVNGYITTQQTVKGRGGTVRAVTLPADTVGLCTHKGKLVTFHHNSSAGGTGLLTVEILPHPTSTTAKLRQIHFAQPLLGFLYVVAEYDDSSVYHFWLQATKTWTANTAYLEGDVVQPTTPNGYSYKAKRLGTPARVWAPSVARAINDVVVPTTLNGYKYTVTAVTGSSPASGTVEPIWPKVSGATVMEGTEVIPGVTDGSSDSGGTSGGATTGGATTGGGGTVNLPPEVIERYDRDSELK